MGGERVTHFGQAEQERFFEAGYLRLGRVVSRATIQALCARIDDIMLGRVTYDEMPMQLDSQTGQYGDVPAPARTFLGATLAYRRIDRLERDPLFLSYMQHPLFRAITARFIGPEVSIFRAMFMNKPASQGTILPWHQDIGTGWGIDTNPIVTIWTALDDATVANGCLQILPGSHRFGILNDHHFPTPEQQAHYIKEEDSLFLEAETGEAILLHNFLLHRSGVNPTNQPRRAFSVCYMDAVTREVATGARFPLIFGRDALRPSPS